MTAHGLDIELCPPTSFQGANRMLAKISPSGEVWVAPDLTAAERLFVLAEFRKASLSFPDGMFPELAIQRAAEPMAHTEPTEPSK